ncbi:hypothetical protein OE88DRAFT_1152513 [Heliocybe sulcata]|uniref:Uncharacterized protein n=1 Tax=Heliocybe sulcata TaxID=5364 RepID=A0A5C3N9W9_9AGAM|nr:hypothetical protein OE88DRAFT_1152513 [Heliocybe sulcata]
MVLAEEGTETQYGWFQYRPCRHTASHLFPSADLYIPNDLPATVSPQGEAHKYLAHRCLFFTSNASLRAAGAVTEGLVRLDPDIYPSLFLLSIVLYSVGWPDFVYLDGMTT